jgi:hypothetical protein
MTSAVKRVCAIAVPRLFALLAKREEYGKP